MGKDKKQKVSIPIGANGSYNRRFHRPPIILKAILLQNIEIVLYLGDMRVLKLCGFLDFTDGIRLRIEVVDLNIAPRIYRQLNHLDLFKFLRSDLWD